MVDLVSGMHNHRDGLWKTSVGRLRRWYSLSNWVIWRAAEVPNSIIGLGSRFSWEMLEEIAHWKVELQLAVATPIYIIFIPQLHHKSIPEIGPRLLQFQWWRWWRNRTEPQSCPQKFNFYPWQNLKISFKHRANLGIRRLDGHQDMD